MRIEVQAKYLIIYKKILRNVRFKKILGPILASVAFIMAVYRDPIPRPVKSMLNVSEVEP
jgi:hypothetical protein